MDLLLRLFRWFLALFGSPARSSDAISGLDELEGADAVHVHGTGPGAKLVRREPGADLVEDGGQTLWVDTVDKRIPRAQWQDVWGPLGSRDRVVDFIVHEMLFQEKQQADPVAAEAELRRFGYSGVGQLFAVRATILKHFGQPTGPNLGDALLGSTQEYANFTMQAGRRRVELLREAQLAAQPQLLAPIEGISLETYAALSAYGAQQPPDFARRLAQHGLDQTAWSRVNTAWMERMSQDTTGSLATAYGEAFMKGQGNAIAWNGTAAAGPEPIAYEKMCEIAGALSAWGKSGQDVNMLLSQQFGMSALDVSKASTWWMTQLTADLGRFQDYNARLAHWEQHYGGGARRPARDVQF